jgi:hypothetical protein
MKSIIKLLITFLTFIPLTSCMAQQTDSLSVGRTIGFVVGDAEKGVFVSNSKGPDLIINGDLEIGTEYDIVYRILSRRDRVIVADLIKAEHSAKENSKRRALLIRELKIEQAKADR